MSRIKLILLLAMVVFLSGCTENNLTIFASKIPEVEAFIQNHPNTEMTVVKISSNDLEKIINETRQDCGVEIPIKDYWKVKLYDSEKNITMISWVDYETNEPICTITKAGVSSTSPEIKNESVQPELTENKVSDSESKSYPYWYCENNMTNSKCNEYGETFCKDVNGVLKTAALRDDNCCVYDCITLPSPTTATIPPKNCRELGGYICQTEGLCQQKLLNSSDSYCCPVPCGCQNNISATCTCTKEHFVLIGCEEKFSSLNCNCTCRNCEYKPSLNDGICTEFEKCCTPTIDIQIYEHPNTLEKILTSGIFNASKTNYTCTWDCC